MRSSATATPYGDTLTPTGLRSSRNGNTITWTWNLPENGRPITDVQVRGAVDQTFGGNRTQVSRTGTPGNTYRLEVRAKSAAGWSAWAGPVGESIPDPKTVDVLKGSTCSERSCNTGNGSCTSAGCRWIAVRTSGFGGWSRAASRSTVVRQRMAQPVDGWQRHEGERQLLRRDRTGDRHL